MARKDKDILINYGLNGIVNEGKKLDMSEKDMFGLEERVLSVIHIHLSDEIYHNILQIKCLSAL